jgi:hypothetical protein
MRKAKIQGVNGAAWRAFYESPEGRVALGELAVWCNAYAPIDSNDPIEIARMTGERNVYMRIAALIGHKPGDFLQHAQDDTDILDRMLRSN